MWVSLNEHYFPEQKIQGWTIVCMSLLLYVDFVRNSRAQDRLNILFFSTQ
jgi:hypothetical protein